jgi:hypothetical protein
MRKLSFAVFCLSVGLSGPSAAQEWGEYVNTDDLFLVNFPGQPRVEEFVYVSEYGSPLQARRYIAEDASGRYSVTVVEFFTTIRPPGRHGVEMRGSMAYAATELRRTGEVTYDAYSEIQVVPGHQLQITLPDGRRNFAQLHYLDHRLYIVEAVVPGNFPPPAQFQVSIAFINANGEEIRFTGEGEYQFPDGRPLLRVGGREVTSDEEAARLQRSITIDREPERIVPTY